jgi:hypothetical protein
MTAFTGKIEYKSKQNRLVQMATRNEDDGSDVGRYENHRQLYFDTRKLKVISV